MKENKWVGMENSSFVFYQCRTCCHWLSHASISRKSCAPPQKKTRSYPNWLWSWRIVAKYWKLPRRQVMTLQKAKRDRVIGKATRFCPAFRATSFLTWPFIDNVDVRYSDLFSVGIRTFINISFSLFLRYLNATVSTPTTNVYRYWEYTYKYILYTIHRGPSSRFDFIFLFFRRKN